MCLYEAMHVWVKLRDAKILGSLLFTLAHLKAVCKTGQEYIYIYIFNFTYIYRMHVYHIINNSK